MVGDVIFGAAGMALYVMARMGRLGLTALTSPSCKGGFLQRVLSSNQPVDLVPLWLCAVLVRLIICAARPELWPFDHSPLGATASTPGVSTGWIYLLFMLPAALCLTYLACAACLVAALVERLTALECAGRPVIDELISGETTALAALRLAEESVDVLRKQAKGLNRQLVLATSERLQMGNKLVAMHELLCQALPHPCPCGCQQHPDAASFLNLQPTKVTRIGASPGLDGDDQVFAPAATALQAAESSAANGSDEAEGPLTDEEIAEWYADAEHHAFDPEPSLSPVSSSP